MSILETAVQRACEDHLPILLASTTGDTASKILDLLGQSPVKLHVLTHEPRRVSPELRFSEAVRARLLGRGDFFMEDRAPFYPPLSVTRWLEKTFGISAVKFSEKKKEMKYGKGGKVCFLIAQKFFRSGTIPAGRRVLVLGGVQKGIDTAMIMEVRGESLDAIEVKEILTASRTGGRSMKNCLAALLLGIGLFHAGCSTVSSWVQDFNLVSIDQEKTIGAQMAKEIEAQKKVIQAPTADKRKLDTISAKLVKALPRRDFEYRFFIVEDASPNAFTIPGGTIYVHTGLFKFAGDSELAGVLAHEIGHAYERHPVKAISRSYGADYLLTLLGSKNQNRIRELALKAAKTGILLSYGRGDENEADLVGFYLLKKAGYPPDGLLSFLRKLEKIQGSSQVPTFLSTHPPTPERIERLEQLSRPRISPNPAASGRG